MKFCDKLQKIRKENNITQEGLADKLNVSRQAVSKWESGIAYPDTDKLIQISKIFNISLDELINDNVDLNKKNNPDNKKKSFMEIFNNVLDFIFKSINMFWSMKFIDKIKCIFELGVLSLIILLVAIVFNSIILNIIRRILVFLPSNIVWNISSLFDTLLILAWLVLGIIILIKIFKTRYLDYYIFITDDSISSMKIEEPIKELKEKKEYKVVIRDPGDSNLNIIKKFGKILSFLIKIIAIMIIIPLILLFIFCIIILVFSLFYLFSGLFFNGISIAIFGVILFIYLIIEFIYNLIFNRKHALNKIFIIFILSISLIGIGFGLSFVALSNFDYEDSKVKEVNTHNVGMSDNLLVYPLMYDIISDENIIIDNNLENIKFEIASYGNTEAYLYSYNIYDSETGEYKVIEISYDVNEIEFYKEIIHNLENKKIFNYDNGYDIKMYISNDNLTKLRENIDKYSS